jgi:hypothetical protein
MYAALIGYSNLYYAFFRYVNEGITELYYFQTLIILIIILINNLIKQNLIILTFFGPFLPMVSLDTFKFNI